METSSISLIIIEMMEESRRKTQLVVQILNKSNRVEFVLKGVYNATN